MYEIVFREMLLTRSDSDSSTFYFYKKVFHKEVGLGFTTFSHLKLFVMVDIVSVADDMI